MLFGGIEAGGTKFVCGVGNENGQILERIQFDTTTPEETMPQIINYFKGKNIVSLGIGCFGPIDPDVNSPMYGYVTSTPKTAWKDYNFLGELKKHFDIPMGFDTDVNVACLGEATYGAAKGLDSCIYLTIGTGVGGGALVEGNLAHGLLHPEMGHIMLRRHPQDPYEGKCPFHKDCFEGLAAGPAIEARWGKKGHELSENSLVWEIEAYYIAQALVNYVLLLSPKKIILGGGVM
ncbi:MAG: ROK family protein, partial [Turicibacter sp.]